MPLPDAEIVGRDPSMAGSLPPTSVPVFQTPPFPASLAAPTSRYVPATPWSPLWGVGAAILIMLSSLLILGGGGAIITALNPDVFKGLQAPARLRFDSPVFAYVFTILLLFSQVTGIGITIWFAGLMNGRPRDVLALRPPLSGLPGYLWAVPAFVVFGFGMGALVQWLWPQSNQADTEIMMQLTRSPAWWLILIAAVVLAPLQEELLFRGFLFSTLAQSRWFGLAGLPIVAMFEWALENNYAKLALFLSSAIGLTLGLVIFRLGPMLDARFDLQRFKLLGLAGTALFTSLVWAVIHGYSPQGDSTIFALGLALSFILWRTGSTRVTMLCHGSYNAMAFLAATFAGPVGPAGP